MTIAKLVRKAIYFWGLDAVCSWWFRFRLRANSLVGRDTTGLIEDETERVKKFTGVITIPRFPYHASGNGLLRVRVAKDFHPEVVKLETFRENYRIVERAKQATAHMKARADHAI